MGNTLYNRTAILNLARYFLKQPTNMKTKNVILSIFAIMCFSFLGNAQRGVRIGYIDMEYILENVPEYKEASIQLEGKVQRWKQDVDKKQKEIDLMSTTLTNERVLLTKELIEEREEEIKIKQDEMRQYQQDRFGPAGDLMIQRKQLVQPIQDQVFNIVQEVAENKKYDFIFDKSADVVMLFAAERNDISDVVLRSINRAAKREEVTSKRDKKAVENRDALSMEEDKAVTEKEQAVEKKQEERAQAAQEKKDDREKIMADRTRTRDSIRAVKKAEFDARRQRLIDEREARKDSILNARKDKAGPPAEDGDGGGK